MSNINLSAAVTLIRLRGPDRVVIDSEGRAVSYGRAVNDFGVTPEIIFIRDDGWTLGAPESLESVAYSAWPDQWVGFVREPETNARSMSEYPAQIV